MASPFVAISNRCRLIVDEGVNPVLDILQEKAHVNALLLANPTWTRGTGGRQVPGQPFPDHGKQEPDDFHGGAYNRIDPRWYGKTVISTDFGQTDGEIPANFDLFDEVVPEAKKRGMRSYAWMEESSNAPDLHRVPNFTKSLEVDVWGRPSIKPCFRNPDYRWWILGRMEDYARNCPIDGIVWCSERTGPMNHLMGRRTRHYAKQIACFCVHCQQAFRERGYDPQRGIKGYQELYEWYERTNDGHKSSDGAFTSFWRILLSNPEILAWEKMWSDGQHQLSKDMYGIVKVADPKKEVAVHIYHELSFSPWYRAEAHYAEMKRFYDWLKPVTYNNCAGPRFHRFVKNLCSSMFGDATPKEVYPLMLKLLGLEEAPYEEIATAGWSADYVKRETERAVRGRERRDPDLSWDRYRHPDRRDESKCTPEGVRDAVKGAFAGGAKGVVLSRKYAEMQLVNLAGAGKALEELGLV